MTKASTTEKARHILIRVDAGERLPDALTTVLRDEVVLCGSLRASGVLADIELRTYHAGLGTLAPPRRIQGPAHVLVLDGSIGLANGDVSLGLRAVIARETESGVETLSGEIVTARVVALEAIVTALDDIVAARALDEKAGVWMLGEAKVTAAPAPKVAPAPPPPAPVKQVPPAPPSAPVLVSSAPASPPPVQSTGVSATPPAAIHRYTRPMVDDEVPFPEAGDVVEHFAFGTCDVVKSDGDRLHLRVQKDKDGRVKEIALEMLKVTALPPSETGQKHFKLDRKL